MGSANPRGQARMREAGVDQSPLALSPSAPVSCVGVRFHGADAMRGRAGHQRQRDGCVSVLRPRPGHKAAWASQGNRQVSPAKRANGFWDDTARDVRRARWSCPCCREAADVPAGSFSGNPDETQVAREEARRSGHGPRRERVWSGARGVIESCGRPDRNSATSVAEGWGPSRRRGRGHPRDEPRRSDSVGAAAEGGRSAAALQGCHRCWGSAPTRRPAGAAPGKARGDRR